MFLCFLQVSEVRNRIKREREEVAAAAARGGGGGGSEGSSNKTWNQDDLQLLIKAVNLFPAGTTKRLVILYGAVYESCNLTESVVPDVLPPLRSPSEDKV